MSVGLVQAMNENIPDHKPGPSSVASDRIKRDLARNFNCGKFTRLAEDQRFVQSVGGSMVSRVSIRHYLCAYSVKAFVEQKKPNLYKSRR
ncbi:hypothetical protein BGW41_001261, partial [Actinomortierella wolfii]